MVKILIMDDEPGLRNIVFNMLKPLGHPLFTAEDGHEAIEVARREIPDLAMLDMRVPDMDGIEVLGELKKINPKIRAIMLSGFGDVDSAINALKSGANEYISKPFKVDEVLAAVNKLLQAIQQESGGTATAPAAPPPQAPVRVAVPPPAVPAPTPAPAPLRKPPPPIQLKNNAPAVGTGAAKAGMKKWAIAGAVAGICIIGAAGFFLKSKGIIGASAGETYNLAYSNVSGICWAAPYLWGIDTATGNIYKHNRDDALTVDVVYKTANTEPSGIAFDGQFLWTCNAMRQRIYKHKMDNTLTIETMYAVENSSPSVLCFDGGDLWVIDTAAAKIYKYKMGETLSLEGTYNSPVSSPCGMFRNGEFFYIADAKTGKLYRVSPSDFAVNEIYAVPRFADGTYRLSSVAWDGKSIWASCGNVGTVIRVPFASLKTVEF